MFLCALGRSHRTARDAELVREAQQSAAVALTLQTRGGTRAITCRLTAGERKKLIIDGTALTRSGELLGCLNVVMFAPEDLLLVKGGPGERRRFLDMEISQLRPAYYYTLQQYNAALKQRNALLKDEACLAAGLLEPWDEQLSRLGAAITAERAEFLAQLRGETPVLLLDDVFSELDRRRQRLLLEAVQGCQTFLTSTHLEQLEAAGALRMQVYHVSGGRVVEV